MTIESVHMYAQMSGSQTQSTPLQLYNKGGREHKQTLMSDYNSQSELHNGD